MNSAFELQIDFKNDWNWIYAFFIEFRISRHIRLHRRHCIYDNKKPSNLHKNSLFSKRHIISNVIAIENYKWCLKKQFLSLSLVKHKLQVTCLKGHKNFVILYFILAIIASYLLLSWRLPWVWMIHEIFTCLPYWWGNDLLRLMYLSIKGFATAILKFSSNMSENCLKNRTGFFAPYFLTIFLTPQHWSIKFSRMEFTP